MEKVQLEKGAFGYLGKRKKKEVIKTIVLFAIAMAVFLTGYLHTGTRNNLLSVVAVLGILPASKSAVAMIMVLRYRSAEERLFERMKECEEQGIVLYDLIFVLCQQAVKTECIVITDTALVIYTRNERFTEGQIAKELKNFLANQGKGSCSVKVCKSEKSFLEQAKSHLNDVDRSEEMISREQAIRDKLLAFSM